MDDDNWFIVGFIVYMTCAVMFILYCKKKKCFDADLFNLESSKKSVNTVSPIIQTV